MSQFGGKVVLITGGNAGIGRAAASQFATQGARVVVSGCREKEGRAVIDEIEASGGEAIFIKADVSKESDVTAMIERTLATFGRLDCAFNNAGIEQALTPLPDQTEETYDQIMDVNVKGVWLSLKHEIPAMLRTGGGAIVNNSSLDGSAGRKRSPAPSSGSARTAHRSSPARYSRSMAGTLPNRASNPSHVEPLGRQRRVGANATGRRAGTW